MHRIISKAGERIPRPLVSALHGQKPNEVVHAYFFTWGILIKTMGGMSYSSKMAYDFVPGYIYVKVQIV